ncbi:hypothetical protein [Neotabrizicola shimadae]|uniref:Uncharacterized protein n=1 Tax=Neotabrizicola shimadae TaxID=2807096 RepID=A0A8G0ZRD7_9RHOB|nr:hypothetical protein [Neotabrizicola shimadae]QYZ70051.1 hypothetical protein JO391_00450 [Neotabrizicola shimadae]
MRWYDVLPGVRGAEPLDDGGLVAWADRQFDDRLRHLRFCPVILTEVYQIARHLPLTVVDCSVGPVVMADLRPESLARPAFTQDGRFACGYRPLATRLLPFFAEPGGRLMRLVDDHAVPGSARPEELRRRVQDMLIAQQTGHLRLLAAARIAVKRGLLCAAPAAEGLDAGYWLPNPEVAVGHEVAEALGDPCESDDLSDHALALRLVAVMEYSVRHRRVEILKPARGPAMRPELQRENVLRQQSFLSNDVLLDFTALTAGQTLPDTTA